MNTTTPDHTPLEDGHVCSDCFPVTLKDIASKEMSPEAEKAVDRAIERSMEKMRATPDDEREYKVHKAHCFMVVQPENEFMGCKYGADEDCPMYKPSTPDEGLRELLIQYASHIGVVGPKITDKYVALITAHTQSCDAVPDDQPNTVHMNYFNQGYKLGEKHGFYAGQAYCIPTPKRRDCMTLDEILENLLSKGEMYAIEDTHEAKAQILQLVREARPQPKPKYVKQRVGRDLFDVPAHSYNQALDEYEKNLLELLGETDE